MLKDQVVIGRRVIYTPWVGCPESLKEKGTVTDVGSRALVFVQYDGDVNSKATSPCDLEYIEEDTE